MRNSIYYLLSFAAIILSACEEKKLTITSFLEDEASGYTHHEVSMGWVIRTTIIPTEALVSDNYSKEELSRLEVEELQFEYDRSIHFTLEFVSDNSREALKLAGPHNNSEQAKDDLASIALGFENAVALKIGDRLIPCAYAHLIRDYNLDSGVRYSLGFLKPEWLKKNMPFQLVINSGPFGILHETAPFDLSTLEPIPDGLIAYKN